MFVFEQNLAPKSVFEKNSRFFPRVAVAPTIMKFTEYVYRYNKTFLASRILNFAFIFKI